MSFREREQQKMIRMYQDETGIHDFHLPDVAAWAEGRGWKMPKPPTAVELLAKQLARTARAETRPDPSSPFEYRANHAYTKMVDGEPKVFWFDIDGPGATKSKVQKSLVLRREQILNDAVHLAVDRDHWNKNRSLEEQISLDFDLNEEVTWRLNAPGDDNEERMAS